MTHAKAIVHDFREIKNLIHPDEHSTINENQKQTDKFQGKTYWQKKMLKTSKRLTYFLRSNPTTTLTCGVLSGFVVSALLLKKLSKQ